MSKCDGRSEVQRMEKKIVDQGMQSISWMRLTNLIGNGIGMFFFVLDMFKFGTFNQV